MKYREPTDEPDATSERDLNTFITQTSESQAQELSEVLELTKKIEIVAKAVEASWGDSVAKHDSLSRQKAQDYMSRFSEITLDRLDVATAHLLRFADDHINDRNELQVEEVSGGLSIGLWSSYSDIRPIRKSVQFEKVGIQVDIPKQILQHDARFIHRIIRCPLETMSYNAYHPDASKADFIGQTDKYVIGDLLIMDILRPPPQAFHMRGKKWILRDRSAQSLSVQRSPYPSSVACRCFFKVPEDIFMSEDVTMNTWDAVNKRWTDDGVTDFQYTESNRTAQFYTTSVGTFALVKDRTADIPYKSWSLQPIRSNESILDFNDSFEKHARLTISTQKMEIVIDIIGNKCRLMLPEVKQFTDLIGVLTTPGCLLHKLQRRGVNLFPSAFDASRCVVLRKPIKVFMMYACLDGLDG